MDGEAKSCTFRWEIQNISQCWWLRDKEGIYSPAFTANELKSSKWSLCFIPNGKDFINFALKREKDCSAPDTRFKIHIYFACLNIFGKISTGHRSTIEFKKNTIFLFTRFIKQVKRVFVISRETFIPEDTLTVQCTMWVEKKQPVKTNYIFATTIIKVNRRSFLWKIDKPYNLASDTTNKFKDKLIDFDLVFCKGFERFQMKTVSFHDNVKFILCKTSVIDSEGKKGNCRIFTFPFDGSKIVQAGFWYDFPDILKENKSLYFPQDILSFDSEFVVSTVEHLGCATNLVKMKYPEGDEDEDEEDNDTDGNEDDDHKSDRVEKAIRCSRPGKSKRLRLARSFSVIRGPRHVDA